MQTTVAQWRRHSPSPSTFTLFMIAATMLCALAFVGVMLPGTLVSFRIMHGCALFVCIAVLLGIPRQLRRAVATSTLPRCAAIGGQCGAVALGIMLLALWLLPPEMQFDEQRFKAIVGMIEAGKLVEARPGVVELPPESANSTADGHVDVTNLPAGKLYLFKTMIVRMREIEFRGYVYSSAPLDSVGLEKSYDGEVWLEATAFDWGLPSPKTPAGKAPMRARPTKWEHWLQVSTCDGESWDGNWQVGIGK